MTVTIEQIVKSIHASPTRLVMAVSGGGSGAVSQLLEVPGASRTVLEAAIPYAEKALQAWIGGPAGHACSAQTARAMAAAAFHRARSYYPDDPTPAGIACTAALSTDRPRRGPHRIHIAAQTAARTALWSLELQKGRRSRTEEERLATRLLLNAVADACEVDERLDLDLVEEECVMRDETAAPAQWQDLMLGRTEVARSRGTDNLSRCTDNTDITAVFPGAFNPLHEGHRRMADVAKELLQLPILMEISITNVDKAPLDYCEMRRRIEQFPSELPVCFTRARTFDEKSKLFPGCWFVVGIDTLKRIAAPDYYGNDESAALAAIARIASRGCRFLVFGRKMGEDFVRPADLDLPESLKAICREVPPERFRLDVSSTELRERKPD
jgi:nicotinamide mononucleotide (NMN) deamidase PncC